MESGITKLDILLTENGTTKILVESVRLASMTKEEAIPKLQKTIFSNDLNLSGTTSLKWPIESDRELPPSWTSVECVAIARV